MSLVDDAAVIRVLWRRDLVLFFRQRSRVLGSLAPAALLWVAIGAGVAPTFRLEGTSVGYLEYFYPGVLLVLLLNVSISAMLSVIEDRRLGFLQGVLVAPASRAALVLGKCLGSTSVGLLHGAVYLMLAPAAGFRLLSIRWLLLLVALGLVTLAMCAGGFALAWWLDSVQGFHVVMGLVLFPLWILSGAFFPARGQHPVMEALLFWNPLSYALSSVRRALYGGILPDGTGLPGVGALQELSVVAASGVILLAIATWACRDR